MLSDDSADSCKRNIIIKFMDCPKCGKFAFLQNVRLAQLASYYCKQSISKSDYQQDIIKEDIDDKNNGFVIELPKKCIKIALRGNN